MVICEEETRGSNREEAKGKEVVAPMAKEWPKESGSLLLHRQHSLSLTFLGDFQRAVVKLYQAPEITRNFVTYLPSSDSQLKLSLQIPQTTALPTMNNNSVKMLGWNNNNNTETADRSQIVKTLREVVKKRVVEFRASLSPLNLNEKPDFNDVVEAVPVSFRPPESTNMDMVSLQKKRVTTLLVGETLLSFELPGNCPFDPKDLDKLAEEERKEVMTPNTEGSENNYNFPRYTFLQRLQGWRMERRQRVNGRFDMYYHHLQSKKVFRSITEVVNFFMYEVYPDKPQKSATKLSTFGEDDIYSKKRVSPFKRKFDESEKAREKSEAIYDLNADINVDHHKPMFDLNDDHHQDYNNNEMYDDVVGDNYQEDAACDQKGTVEKFLAEAYQNLLTLPNKNPQKSTYNLPFDINQELNEQEEEDGDGDGDGDGGGDGDGDGNLVSKPPKNQTVEELLAEAYNNLINYPKNQPNFQKGKEKRSRSIQKPRMKREKTFDRPTLSFPSFPKASININSIPSEKINNNRGNKAKEKITEEKLQKTASSPAKNMKHKRFNSKEVSGNVVFTDVVKSEPSDAAAAATTISATGGGGGSSSAMEVGKSVPYFHMDECDLINHIPESSDMFDLAMFLANNRGSGGF